MIGLGALLSDAAGIVKVLTAALQKVSALVADSQVPCGTTAWEIMGFQS
jgi:hypothetical protein